MTALDIPKSEAESPLNNELNPSLDRYMMILL